MGLLRGKVNLFKFKVEPDCIIDKELLVENLNSFRFHSIEGYSVEESWGWVNPTNTGKINKEDIYFGHLIYLKLRRDKKSIQKKYLDEATKKYIEDNNIEVSSKNELEDIKYDIRMKLMKNTIPNSKTFEVVININTNDVFLLDCSESDVSGVLNFINKTLNIQCEDSSLRDCLDNKLKEIDSNLPLSKVMEDILLSLFNKIRKNSERFKDCVIFGGDSIRIKYNHATGSEITTYRGREAIYSPNIDIETVNSFGKIDRIKLKITTNDDCNYEFTLTKDLNILSLSLPDSVHKEVDLKIEDRMYHIKRVDEYIGYYIFCLLEDIL